MTVPFRLSLALAIAFALVLSVASFAPIAAAQTPKQIGSFKDWDAYAYTDKGKKVCYVASAPLESEPDNVRRGEIFFLVTHRPAGKITDEVNVYLGYPIKADSSIKVEVEGQEFDLEVQGENAWTKSVDEDIKLVAAMIKGNELLVRGESQRGTRTVDRYSLVGFTAAHQTIDKSCGIPK